MIYASRTGNTRKVAEAIADELGVRAVDIREEEPEIGEVDLLVVGDGVYGWRPSREMVEFLSRLTSLKGVKVVLFGTYGAWPAQLPYLRRILEGKGAEVIGTFSCPGEDRLFLGLLRRGRPNEGDLERARVFIRERLHLFD